MRRDSEDQDGNITPKWILWNFDDMTGSGWKWLRIFSNGGL
jgi:hypothetical protein